MAEECTSAHNELENKVKQHYIKQQNCERHLDKINMELDNCQAKIQALRRGDSGATSGNASFISVAIFAIITIIIVFV